jgi:hypothetical protein
MKTWKIQPCTFKQLAALYELSDKVLRNQLKPFQHLIGKKLGHLFSVKQLMIIFEVYSTPPNIEVIYPEPILVMKKSGIPRTSNNIEGFNLFEIKG